jgi:hypothetical protein
VNNKGVDEYTAREIVQRALKINCPTSYELVRAMRFPMLNFGTVGFRIPQPLV